MNPDTAFTNPDFTRRDFLRGGSLAAAMTLLGGIPLRAEEAPKTEPAKPAIKIKTAVIGCGVWGREILTTLQRLPQAEVVAVCDTYESAAKRASRLAPEAKSSADYAAVLADAAIQAVIVATPTHQHKEVALAALKAGKHVYCEAPLAHRHEDNKAIAHAAKAAFKQVFQPGLQMRSDPQNWFLLPFIRAGQMGKTAKAAATWNKKTSWVQNSPNPEREKEVNWRLDPKLSLGLVGEAGIHQLDRLTWFLGRQPKLVRGYGAINHYDDGRKVPDTVECFFEFEPGAFISFTATLASSFEGESERIQGSDASILLRGSRAWLFKEVDAPLYGWEVYARKESILEDTGIVLRADASKQKVAVGGSGVQAPETSALQYALENFLGNCGEMNEIVEDFTSVYDAGDAKAFAEHIKGIKLRNAATWQDGYAATALVIKANEAIMKRGQEALSKDHFELA
jgi:predicted dehydrogenase